MGSRGMECEAGRYYDEMTGNCDPCVQLCDLVDIQGTRGQCERLCPGFLTTTTRTPVITSPSPYSVTEEPWFIAAIVILILFVLASVLSLMYWKRHFFIKRLKRQDCCGEGTSNQPHAQETGAADQPEASSLLMNGAPSLPSNPTAIV